MKLHSEPATGKRINDPSVRIKNAYSSTVALITAAGMSSRMGSFKPLLEIGGMTIIDRILGTFRAAGISRIVVICGNRAEELKVHVSSDDVVCLLNPDYKTTGMFESAKIGMEYLFNRVDHCSRILFTPVDIPLFNVSTVEKLLQTEAGIAKPVFEGRGGHPVLFRTTLVPKLLSYTGSAGLKGAFRRTGASIISVSLDDPGILYDADTPKDLEKLRNMMENGKIPL